MHGRDPRRQLGTDKHECCNQELQKRKNKTGLNYIDGRLVEALGGMAKLREQLGSCEVE
ncbi:MAG TPA: hypothetical protein VJR89_32360 [Polyangiales bacterium]|nr:hypothetical protein [Polyangiales bacterium]